MDALLSIKPEFGEKILEGEKEYEFRKTVFKDPSKVDNIIMYASSPVQRIIGFFSISKVIEGRPEDLWNRFKDQSGIDDRGRFLDYFAGRKTGYAIEIENVVPLSQPVDPSSYIDDFQPPMSFNYVNGEFDFLLDSDDELVAPAQPQ